MLGVSGAGAATPPFRILLVRHGLSAANIDPSVYEHTPEHSIELSPEGKTMARCARY
jgi:broad specificity phosphatase PhoE